MAAPSHTPTMFLKAGGNNPLTLQECEKALAASGYEPDDFGTYDSVLKRCQKARKDVSAAEAAGQGVPEDPREDPLAHKRWIAQGQSGHISENNRHQEKRDKKNETSHCPLYDINLAPCMPHAGRACWYDTQHGAVTQTDISNGNQLNAELGKGSKVGVERERGATRDAIAAALDWGMKDKPAAKQMREKRFNAIAALSATEPGSGDGAKALEASTDAELKEAYDKERDTAVDCVEGFFAFQWTKMAETKKKEIEDAKNGAAGETAAAESDLAKHKNKPASDAKRKAAEARLEQAKANQADAEARWQQVKSADTSDPSVCMGDSEAPAERGGLTRTMPIAGGKKKASL